jgi:hypothetical protein
VSVEGFVTIGRGELLLSLLAVALLCILAGFLGGQLSKMIRRPQPIKLRPITPADEERGRKMLREMCPGPHCDDEKHLAAWLSGQDFSLITNGVLTEMRADLARFRNRPSSFEVPKTMTPDQEQRLIDAMNEFKTRAQPRWPGGDPDDV